MKPFRTISKRPINRANRILKSEKLIDAIEETLKNGGAVEIRLNGSSLEAWRSRVWAALQRRHYRRGTSWNKRPLIRTTSDHEKKILTVWLIKR